MAPRSDDAPHAQKAPQGEAASILTPGDHVAYLLEHVDEHVLFERRERRPVGPQVKACKKTQVERFQIQIDRVTCEWGNKAAGIRWHQSLLPIFAAPIA